ncbi:hypothetical protein K4K51_010793 [Colletotrichum sp. SAR 10_75]|nr:hypothetical protein K4K51_010793 [Colletotrichum sp. SAR 10_75]
MSSPAHQSQYGLQGYQPYEHQGHQRVIPYSKPWHIAKIVMRCSDIVFSLIVIGISAYVLTIAFSGGAFYVMSWLPAANTITAFTALLLINHFILFVRACVETNQRNSRPPVFMVPVNAPPPMQSQAVAGSYVPYPHQPQQAYIPAQQQDKGEQAAASNPSNAGQYVPPGPDGTYYGPASR